ncbi:twitching motility protein PilT [Candidatus Woesearchaeota archaeon]|nr:MAG: twitching motility protein PilT [Candidatus Woesearchaeota archaeon]
MLKVILDTNFLFIPFQFNVDIFIEIDRIIEEKYELFILKETLDELDFLIEKEKGKNKQNAVLAKKLAMSKNIPVLDVSKQKDLYITDISKNNKVDDLLVALSDKDHLVATLDLELKKRIRKKGSKILYLRSKDHLEIGGL